jgi:hypothetical protein
VRGFLLLWRVRMCAEACIAAPTPTRIAAPTPTRIAAPTPIRIAAPTPIRIAAPTPTRATRRVRTMDGSGVGPVLAAMAHHGTACISTSSFRSCGIDIMDHCAVDWYGWMVYGVSKRIVRHPLGSMGVWCKHSLGFLCFLLVGITVHVQRQSVALHTCLHGWRRRWSSCECTRSSHR